MKKTIDNTELQSDFLKQVSAQILPLAEMARGDNPRTLIVIATDEQCDGKSALVGAISGTKDDLVDSICNLMEDDEHFASTLIMAMQLITIKKITNILSKED